MEKTIVTHHSPDLDAILSVWLIKKFWPHWKEAQIKYVSAGDKIEGSEEEVVCVDTGLGKFDHHQDRNLPPSCALVLEDLKKKNPKLTKDEALARLVDIVADFDRGNFINFPEFLSDRYEFLLEGIVNGWKKILPHEKVMELGLLSFDGIYRSLKCRVEAEEVLKSSGIVFETVWGKAVGVTTQNDCVMEVGEREGYSLVVRKDPERKFVRIYARNDRGVDLTPIFEKLKKFDPEATWFLHPSRYLLLNGSGKNPAMKPTKLSLEDVIEVFKKI